jgi:hypothetical protein
LRQTRDRIVNVKFFRNPPGDHSNYGSGIESCLRSLLKTERAYAALSTRTRAKVPATSIVVERHENGPEILGIPLPELAAYVSTLVAIASLWIQVKDRRPKKSSHEVHVRIGSREYRGPIRTKKELRDIVSILKQ